MRIQREQQTRDQSRQIIFGQYISYFVPFQSGSLWFQSKFQSILDAGPNYAKLLETDSQARSFDLPC